MVVFPAATPVTFPVLASMDATAGVLLVHTPPEMLSLKIILAPIHTAVGPLIVPAFGKGFTVKADDAVEVPQTVVTE